MRYPRGDIPDRKSSRGRQLEKDIVAVRAGRIVWQSERTAGWNVAAAWPSSVGLTHANLVLQNERQTGNTVFAARSEADDLPLTRKGQATGYPGALGRRCPLLTSCSAVIQLHRLFTNSAGMSAPRIALNRSCHDAPWLMSRNFSNHRLFVLSQWAIDTKSSVPLGTAHNVNTTMFTSG